MYSNANKEALNYMILFDWICGSTCKRFPLCSLVVIGRWLGIRLSPICPRFDPWEAPPFMDRWFRFGSFFVAQTAWLVKEKQTSERTKVGYFA